MFKSISKKKISRTAAIFLACVGLVTVGVVSFTDIRFELLHHCTIFATSMPDVLSMVRNVNQHNLAEVQAAMKNLRAGMELSEHDYSRANTAFSQADGELLKLFGLRSEFYCLFLFERGELAYRFNRIEEAESFFAKVSANYPDSALAEIKIWNNEQLASIWDQQDRSRGLKLRLENATEAKKAAQLNPYYRSQYIGALESLAFNYEWCADYVSARDTFERQQVLVAEKEGTSSWRYGECLMELGRTELGLQQFNAAEKHLVEALRLFGISHSTYWSREHEQESRIVCENLLAQAYTFQNKFKLAEDCLGRALRMNPVDVDSSLRLSRLMRLEQRLAESEKAGNLNHPGNKFPTSSHQNVIHSLNDFDTQ